VSASVRNRRDSATASINSRLTTPARAVDLKNGPFTMLFLFISVCCLVALLRVEAAMKTLSDDLHFLADCPYHFDHFDHFGSRTDLVELSHRAHLVHSHDRELLFEVTPSLQIPVVGGEHQQPETNPIQQRSSLQPSIYRGLHELLSKLYPLRLDL